MYVCVCYIYIYICIYSPGSSLPPLPPRQPPSVGAARGPVYSTLLYSTPLHSTPLHSTMI